ncbi:MAG: phenylalanine--tRNA ligase subunit beta [Myxococcaceae bacterium]
MKVSTRWLSEFVDLPPIEKLVERLTLAGLEVEGVSRPGEGLRGVVVAQVKEAKPHPQADRLSVTQVDAGSGLLQVVCGAKNFKVGDKVALATVGTVLPGGKRIEEAALRGVTSHGMLCSGDELGLGKTDGLILLDADAQVGAPVAAVLGLDDVLLEINVTPNRPDALSHLGIARDIATLFGLPLRMPSATPAEGGAEASRFVKIRIEDNARCLRFVGRVVEGVKVGPSPAWLARRLEACGIRAINNVVDVTNYVQLELGHPMHAFDLDRVAGQEIVVRRARAGEKLTTLDGKERVLDADDLVISDARAATGLAGIMGGGDSEVGATTTRLLLEAAYFEPTGVRRSAKRHGLHTEASHRFERGADPFAPPRTLARAAELIAKLAGGEVRKGQVDVFPALPKGRSVGLRDARVAELLGVVVPPEQIRQTLKTLGFALDADAAGQSLWSIPAFRPDVEREEDLVEEVARVYGYERIPETLPSGASEAVGESPAADAERRARAALAGAGFDEVVNYSFVSEAALVDTTVVDVGGSPIRLTNPLTQEQAVMRTTLYAGLLENLGLSVRHQVDSLRLYELGRIYLPNAQGGQGLVPVAHEPRILAGLLWGRRDGRTWAAPDVEVDFYDAKGALEAVMASLRIRGVRYEPFEKPPAPYQPPYHPRACAKVLGPSGELLGTLGELHPKLARARGLLGSAFLFELRADVVFGLAELVPTFTPLPRHPAVLRDLAVVVSREVPSEAVGHTIREVGGEWVEDVRLFDQYTGAQIPEGRKNLAFAIRYRAQDKTLQDVEVNVAHQRIVDAVHARFGAALRA